jgi:hypothetical protein
MHDKIMNPFNSFRTKMKALWSYLNRLNRMMIG